MYSEPEGEIIGHFRYFSMELSQDIGLATEITIGVFAEIYELQPDFRMTIKEN